MFATAPLNNSYLELVGATASASVATLLGMANPRTVEVLLDVMLLKTSNTASTDVLLFGKETAGWEFDYDAGAAGTYSGLSFRSARTVTNVASWGATLNYGTRYLFYGKDNGSSVILRVNGSSASATDDSAMGTLSAITTDANPITLGVDGAVYTSLRLYAAWVKVNGISVLHLRPKTFMTATVADLSDFNNDMAVSGTLGTDYFYGRAWSREPEFAGKDTLG